MKNYFDLHCDTLAVCLGSDLDPAQNDLALAFDRAPAFGKWVQAMAAFIHDDLCGEEGYRKFKQMAALFARSVEKSPYGKVYEPGLVKPGVCNAMLTVEGGAALGGNLSHIEEFRRLGVRILSLVWSKETDLAGGVTSSAGLKPKGADAIRELENCGIFLDVSHMNRDSFWQACRVAQKPFLATHSNAFSVCSHPRNLDDEQVREMVSRGGLIGLNYCVPFLKSGVEDVSYEDLAAHIDRFLSLGAENLLCCGSDFDGATVPSCMRRVETMPAFGTFLAARYGEEMAEKITFSNAESFFEKNAHWEKA